MPKINFSVPFLNEKGEPIQQLKVDPTKIRIQPNGQAAPQPILDDEGNAVLETIMVSDLLARILNMAFPGDDAIAFDDKARRGKLARKICAVGTQNYPDTEIAIIRDLTAKTGSTVIIAQLDDLLVGEAE